MGIRMRCPEMMNGHDMTWHGLALHLHNLSSGYS